MSTTDRYSDRLDQALILATLAHDGATRKGKAFPYIMHPVHVAWLLERHGFSEDVAIAGLLHDVLEDAAFGAAPLQQALRATFDEFKDTLPLASDFRTATEALISSRFSPAVLDLVLAVTEVKAEGNEERPWRIRKEEQLAHIPRMSRDAAALKAADTLHNVQSVLRDAAHAGVAAVWKRFSCTPEETLWYYGAIAEMLRIRLERHPLALELDEAVSHLTGAVDRSAGCGGARCPFCASDHPLDTTCAEPGASTFVVMNADGKRIRSLAQWRRLAPPAGGDRQWVPGRSAMEAARAWSGLVVPHDVLEGIGSVEELAGFRPATVLAELVTPLDDFGEGRNHDLIVLGIAGGKRVVIGIEVKSDEQLGPRIGPYLEQVEQENDHRRAEAKTRLSRVPERIRNLTHLVFGDAAVDLVDARYQLLHGLGGTLLECAARQADVAIFLVHAFTSDVTDDDNVQRNQAAAIAFAEILQAGAGARVRAGHVVGPFQGGRVEGTARPIPFYFGLVHTDLNGTVRHRLAGGATSA
jgi:hypothetical protein